MTPEIMFDGAHLRLLHVDHGHKRLMVTLDFRAAGKDDFGPANPSQGFAAHGFDQLMIKTRQNDWFINSETLDMERLLGPLTARYDRVHVLGFSMGGYGAFRFAKSLKADWVVAVSPQISLDAAVVPFERRYRDEAQGFDTKIGQMPAQPDQKGVILFDPFVRPDLAHAKAFAKVMPQLTFQRLCFGGHPASGVLRDAGRSGVLQRVAMQVIPPARATKIHRKSRAASGAYWTRLAQRAATSHPRLTTRAQAHAKKFDPHLG